jgi:hypothetical protein
VAAADDPPVPDETPAPAPPPSEGATPPPTPPPRAEPGESPAGDASPSAAAAAPAASAAEGAPAAAAATPGAGAGAPPPRRESPLVAGISFAWRARRALALVVLVQLLFGLSIALPFRARIGPHLDSHVHASAFAGAPDRLDLDTDWPAGLDWGVWNDVKREEAPFFEGLGLAMVWIGVLAWAFGQAVAGGFLGTAAEDLAARAAGNALPPPTAARFLAAAGRWFLPSLRTSLVFLAVTMLLARRAVFEVWGGIAGDVEAEAESQAAGFWGARTRESVFLGVFLVLRAAADLGRAHLVVGGRKSAVLAFLRGIGTLARHPLRAGGLAVLVAVPEALLLLALAAMLPGLPESTWVHLVAVFLVLQAAVLVRWAARAALLAGNVRLLAR